MLPPERFGESDRSGEERQGVQPLRRKRQGEEYGGGVDVFIDSLGRGAFFLCGNFFFETFNKNHRKSKFLQKTSLFLFWLTSVSLERMAAEGESRADNVTIVRRHFDLINQGTTCPLSGKIGVMILDN